MMRVMELAKWAEHPAGVEVSIRKLCRSREQLEAARQAADEKARREQAQRDQDRAKSISLREGIRKYRPKFLDSAGAGAEEVEPRSSQRITEKKKSGEW